MVTSQLCTNYMHQFKNLVASTRDTVQCQKAMEAMGCLEAMGSVLSTSKKRGAKMMAQWVRPLVQV